MPFSGRSIFTQLKYEKYKRVNRKLTGCRFCDSASHRKRDINIDKGQLRVVSNDFPYSVWQGKKLIDHLMIVPKRHVESLLKMNDSERDELLQCIAEYEAKGYTFYLRAPADPTRSVAHLHGHLLKLKSRVSS